MDLKKVKMKFSEHKYYNDLNVPMFEAGKVYDLEGYDWIQRWLKRGGEIVEDVVLEEAPLEEVDQDLEALADDEEKLDDDSKEETKTSKAKKVNKSSKK